MSKIKLKTIRGPIKAFDVPVTVLNLHKQEVEIIFKGRPRSRTEWAPQQKALVAEQLHAMKEQAEKAKAAEAAQAAGLAVAEGADGGDGSWDGIIQAVDRFDAVDVAETTAAFNKRQAEIALLVAEGWDLDDEFCEDTLIQLEDQFPGITQSLVREYGKAINGAREKN